MVGLPAMTHPTDDVAREAREIRRTRLLPQSSTSRPRPSAARVTPMGEEKDAAVPTPSKKGCEGLPPASVLTFQMQGSCAASPVTGQAVAGEQGAHAAEPLANVPMGQVVAV